VTIRALSISVVGFFALAVVSLLAGDMIVAAVWSIAGVAIGFVSDVDAGLERRENGRSEARGENV